MGQAGQVCRWILHIVCVEEGGGGEGFGVVVVVVVVAVVVEVKFEVDWCVW